MEHFLDHIQLNGFLGIVGGYLLGSIPFGLVLAYLGGYGDIRKIGSGNIGATNVLRTGNKSLAALTLVLDSSKGAVAVILFSALLGIHGAFGAALGAVLGHNFPVWLKFKGGKGVATTLGTLLALSLPTVLLTCLAWLLSSLIFRISSLSALIAMLCAPVFALYFGNPHQFYLISLLTLLVFIRHHANIRRLIKGEEPRIGKKNG